MDTKQALQVLRELHNICIQKGVYANVDAVDGVSAALNTLAAAVLRPATETKKTD